MVSLAVPFQFLRRKQFDDLKIREFENLKMNTIIQTYSLITPNYSLINHAQ